MSLRFVSPYLETRERCRWLKGNHHGHTVLSDGADEPEETLEAYQAAGYNYFAFSEHDRFVEPAAYRRRTSMTLLPAVEVTSKTDQTLMLLGDYEAFPAARTLDLKQLSEHEPGGGRLFIANHPNWLYKPETRHVSVVELMRAPAVSAIEIYTGVIERLPGDPCAADVWDALLSAGRRVFGHAVDDQHGPVDRFLGFNLVQWPEGAAVTARGIVDALAAGRFVASSGVEVYDIGLSEDRRAIEVESDAQVVRWIVRDGVLAHVARGGSARFSLDDLEAAPRLTHPWRAFRAPDEALYVRAELIGVEGRRAWSQPFFIEPNDA